MTKSGNFIQHLLKRFKSDKDGNKQEDLEKIAAQEQKQFPFETLVSATKDFHPNHKLGQGGFGPVYKGKLDDGREIAVKKLSQSSSQGKPEFMNEAKLLARVQHRNVVTLLGYCAHGSEKLLVYEYVANESLDKLLFKSGGRDVLDWKRRYNIISGIARGLLYLHEDSRCIITHRDIKASNILLDDKWVPKIADFGMARLFPEDLTHVNTRVAGTNGYMAPEYAMHGHLSPKTDVYSFGVVVLELISGQKNSTFNLGLEDQNLLEWAYKLYKKGKSLDIMDPALASSAVVDQVAICVQIGLLCTQSDPQLRPTMRRVVLMLSKKPGTLEEPMRPGYPGSRYRRSRRPNASSSTAGTSGESNPHAFGSTTNTNTISHSASTTGSTSYLSSQRLDPYGKRPMQGKIKLNTGGSSKGDPGPAGFGGLFRDESGAWVYGYYGNLKHSTNLEAELWGIYRGLTIIFEKGISNIEIESDSKLAVKLIQEGSNQSFTDRVLVEDSRFLLKRCCCIIKHILREENQCASLLANTGVDQNEQLVVLEDPPDNVRHLLEC